MSSKQFLFKVLLCGDGAVGKTSIREQYMGKGFAGSYMKTIGADFASHKTEIGGHQVTYQIFDLAGQDAYTVARKAFYKGGMASFLIFDLQDQKSLHNLKNWIN
ncbi:MAG: Rab family GTPase, partial [Candidatus Kariarchaeaceae archaeon]